MRRGRWSVGGNDEGDIGEIGEVGDVGDNKRGVVSVEALKTPFEAMLKARADSWERTAVKRASR